MARPPQLWPPPLLLHHRPLAISCWQECAGGGGASGLASPLGCDIPSGLIFWTLKTFVSSVFSFCSKERFTQQTHTEHPRSPEAARSPRTTRRPQTNTFHRVKFVFHKPRHVHRGQNRDTRANQKITAPSTACPRGFGLPAASPPEHSEGQASGGHGAPAGTPTPRLCLCSPWTCSPGSSSGQGAV